MSRPRSPPLSEKLCVAQRAIYLLLRNTIAIVSLLQLAAGERTFLVDMLYVCSSRTEAAATRAASVDHDPAVSTGLTNTESLLEEALVGVLGTTEVVKVGMGPKVGARRREF